MFQKSWFEQLVGFRERDAATVYEQLHCEDGLLKSAAKGQSWKHGKLEVLSLGELRSRLKAKADENTLRGSSALTAGELVADVQQLHLDPANAGAFFQVASQFNLLEMVSPDVRPEAGVSIYERDRTQGPACAIACGAGTIYRNYFVEVKGKLGQTKDRQIDCLEEFGRAIGNEDGRLWTMQNGYALPTRNGLPEINETLSSASESQLDELRSKLKIGLMWDTQVTLRGCNHHVTQAYCSALPVGYCKESPRDFEPFARLVLEAAYESTLIAAVLNASSTDNRKVFLTQLGGGVFCNETSWIHDAIVRACRLLREEELSIQVVSFGRSNSQVQELVRRINFGEDVG